ncbi:MAG: Holliday junction ATP-dependent DNA helicase RuvB [Holosporales bacterium]
MNSVLDMHQQNNENYVENSIRPLSLSDFTGQRNVCENLGVFIYAAKERKESLDHVLLYGPPGLGKTTLAQIVAKEMGVGFRATSGPILSKAGDLAAVLTNLQPNDVLFIDEIHRLNSNIEEVLYPAMEDFKLDIMIGEGPAARSIRIDLPPFTLIAATTRSGLLSEPLRDRFGIPLRLSFYDVDDLTTIIHRAARILNIVIETDAAREIAKRSRGTPRIAGRLLRRVRDYAQFSGHTTITHQAACDALDKLEVDPLGLDLQDIRYLRTIAEFYKGGPVGVETLAAALSEQRDTLEEAIEPYLIQQGFLQRTPRGRLLTDLAYQHLGLLFIGTKTDSPVQKSLF